MEAGGTGRDGRARVRAVNPHCLQLQAEDSPAVETQNRQLCGLKVRERAKQVELAVLCQKSNRFRLTEESEVTTPCWTRLRGLGWSERCSRNANSLDEPFSGNEKSIPLASLAWMHPESRCKDRVTLVLRLVGDLLEVTLAHDQHRWPQTT